MNYILQLNAFWEWADTHCISSTEIALYVKILSIANKTGWKSRFTVPNSTLAIFTKTTLTRTRDNLVKHGLITYEKGKKGQSPLYGIVPLYGDESEVHTEDNISEENQDNDENIGTDISTDIGTKNDTENIGTDIGTQIGTDIGTGIGSAIGTDIGSDIGSKNSPIHKLNKTKQNETKTNNIYPLTPTPSDVVDLFNKVCLSFPKVTRLSDARLRTIKARLKKYSIGEIEEAFQKAEQSDFLKGTNSRGWRADFDWLMKEGNIAKVLDGNYDNFTPVKEGFDPYTDKFDHKTLEELTRRMPT